MLSYKGWNNFDVLVSQKLHFCFSGGWTVVDDVVLNGGSAVPVPAGALVLLFAFWLLRLLFLTRVD